MGCFGMIKSDYANKYGCEITISLEHKWLSSDDPVSEIIL
jgi:hypothetical protein